MNTIEDVYAPFNSRELRDEGLPLTLKIMYKSCKKKRHYGIWKRPLKKLLGELQDGDLTCAISVAGFKEGYMELTSLGKVITEVLVGNQRSWQTIGRRTRDVVYRHEYKLMLKNDALMRDLVQFNQLLTQQNTSFFIIGDLLGLSKTWCLEHFFIHVNFRGKLGHREKLLSLLHKGPTTMWMISSNGIESLGDHIVQLQSVGYGIRTTYGVNGELMFELSKVPVNYVDRDTDDCAHWEEFV